MAAMDGIINVKDPVFGALDIRAIGIIVVS